MKQESGDSSNNIQAGGNVTIGLTYDDARQLFLDLFRANFYELSQIASAKAAERAQEITEKILKTLYEENPQLTKKLSEPSVQSSLFTTQKEFAKTGNKELEAQLINLLISRIDSEERSLKQIVLDEALLILPKLTQDHINLLTFVLSVTQINYTDINNVVMFENLIENIVVKFFPKNMSSYSFFTHLQYCGCYMLPTALRAFMSFEEYYRKRFKGLLTNGFTAEQLRVATDGLDVSVLDNFIIKNLRNPELFQFNAIDDNIFNQRLNSFNLLDNGKKLKELWDKTAMSNEKVLETLIKINSDMKYVCLAWKDTIIREMHLTSVGYAIAIANYNHATGEMIKFETFI